MTIRSAKDSTPQESKEETSPESGPTYGQLQAQVAQLEQALQTAAQGAAQARTHMQMAEKEAETIKSRVSREKRKILDRVTVLEARLKETEAGATAWAALKASPIGKYIKTGGEGSDKVPGTLSKKGDWIAPLLLTWKKQRASNAEAGMVDAIERHANLQESRPKQCVCPACKLRRVIEDQASSIVDSDREIQRLQRTLAEAKQPKGKPKK